MNSKNNEKINIQLQERDLEIILDYCRYKGLPNKSISNKHFNCQKSCNGRLLKLEKTGYIKKMYHVESNGDSNLLKGPRKTAIGYATHRGQQAVNYKIKSVRYQKLIPKQENLDKHILLGQIYEKVDPLISSSEAHIDYMINNSIPVLCAIEGEKLMVISALNKADSNKTRIVNNLNSFIKNRTITSNKLPVMYIVITPKFPKQLILHDFNYLPWPVAPLILQNLNKDINHYKRSFQRIFINAGYLPLEETEHFWQVSKNDQTYNITELVTGSSELMRILTKPLPNTYVYIISRAHLYNVTMGYGQFLAYSAKDKATYRVIPKPGGKHHFEKVKDGIIV